MLFLGEYRVTFTGKGRIVIPKKIRDAIGDCRTITITKGFDQCLSGFRNEDWEKSATELMSNSVLEMKKVEMKRHLFSSATILEIDDQGRVVLPNHLLEYGQLEGSEATLIGVGTYFEIWNSAHWKTYINGVSGNIKAIAQNQDPIKNG